MQDTIIDTQDKTQLELYIHIPFCANKCNYCDFLSFPTREEAQLQYVQKLCREIELAAPMVRNRYTVSTIFIGGGTPSLLDPALITLILDTIRRQYSVRSDAEISIECNPASTIAYKFRAYRAAGINRLSIGLQSADNRELHTLGRIHIFEDFLKCYQNARLQGFQNINIDLMNDIPGQTAMSWRKTLRNVLMLKPEHVSIYNLIVEEGTPFYAMQEAGILQLPEEDTAVRIDEITKELTAKYGYHQYEVSNYAKPGFACRHNYGYWSDVPYLGFGLGAASYLYDTRWSDIRDFRRYLELDFEEEAARNYPNLHEQVTPLSRNAQMEEFMFLGLRRIAGISALEFKQKFQVEIDRIYGPLLERFTSEGLLQKDGYRYRFTPHGMDVSNQILSEFLLED